MEKEGSEDLSLVAFIARSQARRRERTAEASSVGGDQTDAAPTTREPLTATAGHPGMSCDGIPAAAVATIATNTDRSNSDTTKYYLGVYGSYKEATQDPEAIRHFTILDPHPMYFNRALCSRCGELNHAYKKYAIVTYMLRYDNAHIMMIRTF